jgi:valyl-tRNA synthetase
MPFVTETIWQELPKELQEADQLIVAAWPKAGKRDPAAEKRVQELLDTVTMLRRYRKYAELPERVPLAFVVTAGDIESDEAAVLKEFARLEWRRTGDVEKERALAPTGIKGNFGLKLNQERLKRESAEIGARLARIDAQLKNKTFIARAPKHIVRELTHKRAQYEKGRQEILALLD